MSESSKSVLVLLALATAAAACNSTEPEDTLTMAEAEALYWGSGALLDEDANLTVAGGTGDGIVWECPLGGTVGVDGNLTERMAGDTAFATADVSMSFGGCGFAHDGIQFTVGGQVRQVITFGFTDFAGLAALEGSMSGAVDWEVDDRSGPCAIDLVLSASLPLSEANPARMAGMLCGWDVELPVDGIEDLVGGAG